MGFWQNLVDSYDKNADALSSKYPLSATSISNNADIIAVIVIDENGNFKGAEKIEKSKKDKTSKDVVQICIPATEKSNSRSSGIAPYPVFDHYEYLKSIGDKFEEYKKSYGEHHAVQKRRGITDYFQYTNRFYAHCKHVGEFEKKMKGNTGRLKKWNRYIAKIKVIEDYGKLYDAYFLQLEEFAKSEYATPQVKAIFKYIAKRTIENDLNLKQIAPKDKTNILFKVEIPDNPQTKVWEDKMFFIAWQQHYLSEKRKSAEKKKFAEDELAGEKKMSSSEKKLLKEDAEISDTISLDYITGEMQPVAASHPKKISNASANSKLVSDNDKTNFTFRGKFSESSEAVAIGYETSQKAHQFLRYLINDRGYYCGEQVILSFTVGSIENSLPPPLDDTKSTWDFLQESQTKTETDKEIILRAETGFDYADALRKSLDGFGYNKTLIQHAKTAVVALDAATTGRLSITFYREMDRKEYLENIAVWHDDCKWNQRFWSTENLRFIPYVGAPSIDKIIQAVYGKPRGAKDESYTKIKKTARERLLRCIFDKAFLPKDYITAAIRRTFNPLGVTTNGKFDRNGFEQLLSTTCALMRKDYLQRTKEVYKLSIEQDRTDRDYLYGRLLGAADKLEEYALYKKKNDRVVTAAIRHMQAFAQHPFRTWQTIHGCLNPYIQKVKGSFAFNEIQAVNQLFKPGEFEDDTKPLNGSYLIGYYHERSFIDNLVEEARAKKHSITNNIEKENDNVGQ